MASFRYSYNPPGVMGVGHLPPGFGGIFPSFGSRPPRRGNYPGTYPSTKSSVPAAAALPAAPPVPTATPSTPSAGISPDFANIINSILGQLGGAGGGIDPLTGIPLAKRALIQYGELPTGNSLQGVGLKNLGGAFDSGTAQLAAANTASGISLVARIKQADADRQRMIKNSLAAHGILGSGETGFQYGREQTDYARARADSLGKLLDYLGNLNSGIASYLQQQALMDALRRLLAGQGSGGGGDGGGGGGGTFGDYPQGPQPPPMPPGWYGPGSYRTPGGNTLL